jgi:hypothetical protein
MKIKDGKNFFCKEQQKCLALFRKTRYNDRNELVRRLTSYQRESGRIPQVIDPFWE